MADKITTESIKVEALEKGVYVVTFDKPDSSANVFDKQTLTELDAHIDKLSANMDVKGIIFTSAKDSIFIAGADIKELSSVGSDNELREIIQKGQKVFSRIAELKATTVATIHGACLGGGYELCLACDYRIASDDRATKIGLPETNLGILPAWGGCTRLPRLIGLPKALDAILAGKRFAAKPAARRGMIDQAVPKEHMRKVALKRIEHGKPARNEHWLTNNVLAARIIASQVRPKLEAKTRGNYPANPKALEVITQGISRSVQQGLKLEENAIIELAKTEACKNLIGVFFLQERSKRMRLSKEAKPKPVGDTAVIGAGIMGAGIAQWLSARGHNVILKDINPDQVLHGMASISKVYHDATKRHIFTPVEARKGMDRIYPVTDDVPMQRVDVIIEAAVENLDIKRKIFARLDELSGDETILATNTSALPINEIAKSTKRPGHVIGIHFFNPVHRMQLVEIVVGEQTDPAVVERTLKFVQRLGKMPVVVKDRPGFLVNRILMPYLAEAGHLFQHGADLKALDLAMLNFGMPMGPLRLIDEVGVDVCKHVADHLSSQFGERMPVPAILNEMVEAKLLGRKSGAGFYVYKGKGEPEINEKALKLVKDAKFSNMDRTDLGERMVLLMVNEAARCLEEGVVESPEDVDFGMIMGTGFAPFRGGVCRYADKAEIQHVVTALGHLAEDEDKRFAPCDLLQSMAKDNKKFYKD